MSPDDLLIIAKKMGHKNAHVSYYYDGAVFYDDPDCEGRIEIFNFPKNILQVMCHFRIWIDDKPDGSVYMAYHFDGTNKHVEERRPGPATPDGIVEVVLALALRLSEEK